MRAIVWRDSSNILQSMPLRLTSPDNDWMIGNRFTAFFSFEINSFGKL